MIPRRSAAASLTFAVAAAGLSGCGSGRADPSSSQGSPSPTTTSVPGEEAGPPSSLGPAAEFSIVREPDTGCVATTTAQPIALATGSHDLTDLQGLGDRFLARTLLGDGFFVFDANGSGLTLTPLGPAAEGVRAAASATDIVAVGVDSTSAVVVQHFDPSGSAGSAAQQLGEALPGRPLAVGRKAGSAGVVWAAPGPEVRVRVLDEAGKAGAAVTLESGSQFDDFTAVVAPSTSEDNSSFLVVWAVRRTTLAAYRVHAALVSHERVIGLPRVVFGSDEAVRVVGLATYAKGAVLLANIGGAPVVVPLDVLGRVADRAHLLEGANDAIVGGGHGLALEGDTVAVVARHATNVHALRLLDLGGRPREGWICLDGTDGDTFHLGGIAADGNGWATILATADGSALLRLDRSGKGPR